MSELRTFRLPLRPHLAAFVQKIEHLKTGEPLRLPGVSAISFYLDSLLTDVEMMTRYERLIRVRENTLAAMQTEIRVETGLDKCCLPTHRIAQFNDWLEKFWRDELSRLIQFQKNAGVQEKITIEKFMRLYGLDEYIEFDAVKKAQFRLRTERGLPHLRTQNAYSDLEVAYATHRPPFFKQKRAVESDAQLALSFG